MSEANGSDIAGKTYDLAVVGAGPGGYTAAIRAGQLGADVLLVEGEQFGGTCLNWGCIPTKALYKTAEVLEDARAAGELGLKVEGVEADFPAVMKRKDSVVQGLRGGIGKLLEANGVEVLRGWGEISPGGELKVTTPEGEEVPVAAERILLAVGSVPAEPPIPGLDLPGVVDSRELLGLDELPERMVVIGGGIIGMEFASILSALGSEVTVLEMLPGILPPVDDEVARRMGPMFKKKGITTITRATVTGVEEDSGELVVGYERRDKEEEVRADLVLVATGRVPNTRGLPLDELGIEHERGAIRVNDEMVTTNPRFLAIGDAVARMMLAHVASSEALVAVECAFGEGRSPVNYRAVPSVVFTLPPAASVGFSEPEAEEEYEDVRVAKFPFAALGKAVAQGKTDGLVKIIFDGETRRVLGLHVLGAGAPELIHEGAIAIQNGLTIEDLAHTVHAHPTLSEAVMEAAHVAVGAPIHIAGR